MKIANKLSQLKYGGINCKQKHDWNDSDASRLPVLIFNETAGPSTCALTTHKRTFDRCLFSCPTPPENNFSKEKHPTCNYCNCYVCLFVNLISFEHRFDSNSLRHQTLIKKFSHHVKSWKPITPKIKTRCLGIELTFHARTLLASNSIFHFFCGKFLM